MHTQLRVFNIRATVIAVSTGLVVLAAYFVRLDILVALRLALVSFVSLLAAWAVLLAVGIAFSCIALIFNALAQGYDFFTYYFTLFLTPERNIMGVRNRVK